ncbi:MAG: ABC transporter permease subunit [Kiritimatiellae bacterium]|nr:ABC transporter permease subunit [Kiritimatiellia bacterium]
MRALIQIWRVACYEWFDALRSRRALVVLLLYLAAAVCGMNWSISVLGKIERELTQMLQLPTTEQSGVVSTVIWKSKPFQKMVQSMTRDDLVYQDIVGRHPVELIFAWFSFFYSPLLVVLVSANRIADDLHSGSVRYMISRVARAHWTLGKFIGQALMVAVAFVISAFGAYLVARIRLRGMAEAPALFLPMLNWSLRAWVYSFSYLGLALGLSHLTRSGSKATILGIMAVALFFVITVICTVMERPTGWRSYLPYVLRILPDSQKGTLWRTAPATMLTGCFYLVTLGFCYLSAGYAFFRKRDA